MRCSWETAWVGRCRKPALRGKATCAKHSSRVCASCGEKATHDCYETGQLVCGFPLCDLCEHAIFPDGTNGGVGFNEQPLPPELPKRHCRKTAQVHESWLERLKPE